jgi:hypothetical protein
VGFREPDPGARSYPLTRGQQQRIMPCSTIAFVTMRVDSLILTLSA